MRAWILAAALAFVSACGGPPPAEPDEDVSAAWTAGDDAPLEGVED